MDPIQAMIAVLGTIVCAVWCAFTIDVWVDGAGTQRMMRDVYYFASDVAFTIQIHDLKYRIRYVQSAMLAWNHGLADLRVRALTPATIAIVAGLARLARETRGSLWIPSLADVKIKRATSVARSEITLSAGYFLFGLVQYVLNLCKVILREDHIFRAENMVRSYWAFRPDMTSIRNTSEKQWSTLIGQIDKATDRSSYGVMVHNDGSVTFDCEWDPSIDDDSARALTLAMVLRALQGRARSTMENLTDSDRNAIYENGAARNRSTSCLSGDNAQWISMRIRELSTRYVYTDKRTGKRSVKTRAGRMVLRMTAGDRDTMTSVPSGMDPIAFREWRTAIRGSLQALAPEIKRALPIVDLT